MRIGNAGGERRLQEGLALLDFGAGSGLPDFNASGDYARVLTGLAVQAP